MRNKSDLNGRSWSDETLIGKAKRWIKSFAVIRLSGRQSFPLSRRERAGVRISRKNSRIESLNHKCGASFLPLLAQRGEGRGEELQGTGENHWMFDVLRFMGRGKELNFRPIAPYYPAFLLISLLFLTTVSAQQESTTTIPPVHSDLTLLQCGNLIYAGNKSSVCFADNFLTDVRDKTNLRVNPSFCSVRLDADALFDFPFCVMSGNETFSFTQKERENLRKYLLQGGFLLASPGCSDEKWDKAFRQEIKICFPEYALKQIPMTHPIFSIVNRIPRLTEKHGHEVFIEGLEINGRLVMVYSKEGLNDVQHASGCCCCGGNEIEYPALVNVNVFTYAVLY